MTMKRFFIALAALVLLAIPLAVAQNNQVFTGTVSVGGVAQNAKYTTGTTTTTFTAGQLTGSAYTVYDSTATTPGSIATRTATEMVGDMGATVGATYILVIRNSSGSANTMTVTAGVGVTLTGTMTIAQNVSRVFVVTVNTATTMTIQSIGTFAAAA